MGIFIFQNFQQPKKEEISRVLKQKFQNLNFLEFFIKNFGNTKSSIITS